MGKRQKKPEDPPAGLPAWMATFSDLVTLLLTFFVLLTAMANFEDVQRVDAVFKSLRDALGAGGMDVALLETNEVLFQDTIRHQASITPLAARLQRAMAKHVSDDMVRVTKRPNEVRIRLDTKVFFAPGSSTLHPSAYALVADMAEILSVVESNIRIEGYTDAQGDELANWKLSGARAIAVLMALRSRGPLRGERLQAVAMGSFHPGTSIGEPTGWDRRIEIVLRSDDASAQTAAESLPGGTHGPE